MPINARTVVPLFAALAVCPRVMAADAPDWRLDLPLDWPTSSGPPSPDAWGLGATGELVMLAGGRAMSMTTDGQSVGTSPIDPILLDGGLPRLRLQPMPGGGWVGTDWNCSIFHLDTALVPRWRVDLGNTGCAKASLLATTDGVVVAWYAHDEQRLQVALLEGNGTQRWRTSVAISDAAADPPLLAYGDGTIHVAQARITSGNLQQYSVLALAAEGSQRWRRDSDSGHSLALSGLVRRDDVIEAVALDASGGVQLHALDLSGQVAGQSRLPPRQGERVRALVPDGAGGGYVLARADGAQWWIHRFNGAAYLWSRQTAAACEVEDVISAGQCLQVTPDGGVLIVSRNGPAVVQRLSVDGTQRLLHAPVLPRSDGFVNFALAADAETTILTVGWTELSGDFIEARQVIEWWRGTQRVATFEPGPVSYDTLHPAALAVDGSDRLVLAVGPARTSPLARLMLIEPEGNIARDVQLPSALSLPTAVASLDDASLCLNGRVSGQPNLACFQVDTLQPYWQSTVAPTTYGSRLRPLDDGGLDVVRLGVSGAITPPLRDPQALTRHDTEGNVVFTQTYTRGGTAGSLLNTSASGWIASLSRTGQLTRTDRQLQARVIDNLPRAFAPDPIALPGSVADDGAVAWVAVAGEPAGDVLPVSLVQVRDDESVLETPLGHWPAEMESGMPAYAAVARHLSNGDVLVRIDQRTGFQRWAPGDHLHLARVAGNGELLWQRRWTGSNERGFEVLYNDRGDIVVASRRGDSGMVLRWLDGDGQLLDQREMVCGDLPCAFRGTQLDSAGGVYVLRWSGVDADPMFQVWRFEAPAATSLLPISTAALAGTWYSPLQGGQGFGLSLYPQGSRTQLFMPWFTYADEGGQDPGALRWFTVQGDVEADDEEAHLGIMVNNGGRFAAPPATTAQSVGQARLRAQDCGRATLEYRFEGDGDSVAPEGSIALRRLLPAAGGCADAGAGDVNIDPTLTGNWYDPATAGQGVDLHRVEVDGQPQLFGAWYTFDPGEPEGSAADQHWFTLQGESRSPEGHIETTLVQTLGGRFDGAATANHHRVGTARLMPDGCGRLTLRYDFDDAPQAGAFRGLSGQLSLARLGACD